MKKTIVLSLLMILILTLSVSANTGVIRGNIRSENEILSNVTVEIKELNRKIVVNNGRFEFDDLEHTYNKKPYTFIFSKDGYITKRVKRNIGIDRLTLLNVNLEKINNKIKGKTLGNTKVKLNNKETIAENGEYEFLNIKPDNYEIQFQRLGYDSETKKIKVYNNQVINLPFQNLIMNEVNYNDFEENTLIGNYFFNQNFKADEMFYPLYYLAENNKDSLNAVGNMKFVLGNFIMIQDFKIVKYINENGFKNNEDLIKGIKKLIKTNPDKIKKELKIIAKQREKINQVYNNDNFLYSVYHINLIPIKEIKNKPVELNKIKLFKSKFLDNNSADLNILEGEVEESRNITDSMTNIDKLKAEDLLEFEDTYFISLQEKGENYSYKIRRQNINQNHIENIYNFYNIFDNDFIRNFVNPYILQVHFEINDKWRVIFNE